MSNTEYHKINTIFKRDERTHKIILDDYSRPEFKLLKDIDWELTEKVDGTNVRIIWEDEKLRFGGRTDNAQLPTPLFAYLQDLFFESLAHKVSVFQYVNEPVILYGEGYGAKIQAGGGKYTPDLAKFVLFDVKIGNIFLERHNVEDIAEKLGLDVIPFLGYGTLNDAINTVRDGFYSRWGDFFAEGIVAKTDLFNRQGERIISKIKYKDFV